MRKPLTQAWDGGRDAAQHGRGLGEKFGQPVRAHGLLSLGRMRCLRPGRGSHSRPAGAPGYERGACPW